MIADIYMQPRLSKFLNTEWLTVQSPCIITFIGMR